MRPSAFRPGPLLWVLCACLFFIPHADAAGAPSLSVDFDGDGRGDIVRVDPSRPYALRVWLSASGTTQVLVSRRPVQNVVATDLNGDNLPELIASDNQSRIHIWTAQAHGFRRYHPRRSIPKSLAAPTGHRMDGRGREPDEATVGNCAPPAALPRSFFQAPTGEAPIVCARQHESASLSSPAADPFAPRPPPRVVSRSVLPVAGADFQSTALSTSL